MSNFEETKIFEKVKIEFVDHNTGEVHHLELPFMSWRALAKYINSFEKPKKWKVIKIEKE